MSICERTALASSNTDPDAFLPRPVETPTWKTLLGYWTDLLAEGNADIYKHTSSKVLLRQNTFYIYRGRKAFGCR